MAGGRKRSQRETENMKKIQLAIAGLQVRNGASNKEYSQLLEAEWPLADSQQGNRYLSLIPTRNQIMCLETDFFPPRVSR